MVSDKDIKAHEGLVRCGNCYSVFNSSWNLTDDPRNDFIEEPASANTTGLPGSQSSAFTFNILDKAAGTAVATEPQPAVGDREEPGSLVHQEDSVAGVANDLTPETDLEPFPEPEVDDFHTSPSAQEINKEQESLLYFDANDEGNEVDTVEAADSGVVPIEDLTILQTPSFASDISALDQNESTLESELDDEPAMGSLSAESMWPGSEAKFENDDEFDLPATDVDAGTTEAREADVEESLPVLSDNEPKVDTPIIVEPPTATQPANSHAVEVPVDSDLLLRATKEDGDDSLSDDAPAEDEALLQGEENSWLTAFSTKADNSESMPSLESNEEEAHSKAMRRKLPLKSLKK